MTRPQRSRPVKTLGPPPALAQRDPIYKRKRGTWGPLTSRGSLTSPGTASGSAGLQKTQRFAEEMTDSPRLASPDLGK